MPNTTKPLTLAAIALGLFTNSQAASWSVDVARLSPHQRLELTILVITPDASPVTIEITDRRSGKWQTQLVAIRGRLEQRAFVLPGDYSLVVVTGNRSAVRKLHVPKLRNDPLPESLATLPAVELVPAHSDSPDSWFLPDSQGRLHLPLRAREALHLHLLFDTHIDGPAGSSIIETRRSISALIPALKVLSQLDPTNGSLDVTAFDSSLHKEFFHARTLDWNELKQAIAAANPSTVAIADLDPGPAPGDFLRTEIRRASAGDSEGTSVAVLLSSAPPPSTEPRLFSVQYSTAPLKPLRVKNPPSGSLIKASPPSVFRFAGDPGISVSVSSPEEFREALARLLGQLSRL